MALAGTLEIQMAANVARLADDMNKAKAMVGSSMKSIESAVASAKSVLGALGIGLGVGYFVSLIKGSIDAADKLKDLNKSTSIAIEQLAGLKLAAKQSGGDLDSIAASINKLSQNMGKDAEKFKALGISAKDPLEAFKQLSDIFVSIQDPQQRAAVAAAALGKSWAGAAPLLAEGGKIIGEMVERGRQLSGITKEMTEEADKFNDQMAELNTTLGSTMTKAIGPMLPGMNDIATAMREAAKEGGLLLTIWVAMGGAMANLLGMTGAQKTATRLREISDELDAARKRLQAGSTNPPGSNQHFFSFLVPDIKVGEDALVKLRATINALEKEKARLTPAEKAAATGIDPAVAAAAAARAAEFLKEGKEVADTDSAYRGLLKTLKEKLLYESQLTAVAKLQLDLDALSAKQLATITPEREKELTALAREADIRNNLLELSKLLNEQNLAAEKEMERLDDITAQFRKTQREKIEDIQFETKLIGLEAQANGAGLLLKEDEIKLLSSLSKQREIEIGLRQISKDLEREILSLGPEITQATEKRRKELEELADAQRKALPDAIVAREAARLSNALTRNSLEEFNSLWRTVESTGKAAFVAVTGHGENMAQAIGKAIKSGIVDLLYQLTVRKWIINIGASISTSMGMSTAANAAGNGGSLLSGVGNLFGGGSLFGSAAAYGAASGAGASQAAMLAAQTGVFGAEGLAATAGMSAAGAGMAGMAATAIPYVGLAIAAYQMLKTKKSSAVLTGMDVPNGTVSLAGGFRGDVYGNDANQGYRWRGTPVENTIAPAPGALEAVYDEIAKLGRGLGLDTSNVRGMSATFSASNIQDVNLRDALPSILAQVSDQLANQLMPNLRDFAKAGETATQTLARLADETVLLNAQRRTMEIELMEAQGKTLEALAAKREDELAALHPTLRALQQQIYAAQDLATAANGATGSMRTLEQQISDVQQAALDAVNTQIQESRSAANTARQTADSYRQIAASLADAVIRISGGGRGALGANLESLFGKAMTGEARSLEALPQAAEDFLSASKASARTALEFARDQAKVVIMLQTAELASTAMVNWNEYQATLLETQANLLEDIKTLLASPTPDTALLTQQLGMLGTIAELLQANTTQVIAGNTFTVDQTGKILTGNALLGAQTGQIITGNAVQDVIKNISMLDSHYSEAMLRALVTGDVTQNFGIGETVSLLRQLVDLNAQMAVQNATEESDRLSAAAAAAAAAIAAAQKSAAEALYASQKSVSDALRNQQLSFVQSQGGGVYSPEDITKGVAQIVWFYLNGTEGQIRQQGDAYEKAFLEAYALYKAIPGHATGGIASGWSMVGERGPELVDFATPGRVYTAGQTRAMTSGAANDDLVAEVRALRADVARMQRDTRKTADILTRVSRDGEVLLTEVA